MTVLVFAPEAGAGLIGQVNKIGADHIGLRIYDWCLVSIAKSKIPKDYEYDEMNECWVNSKTGKEIGKKMEVKFVVERLKFESEGLQPQIIGTMLTEGTGPV